MRFCLELTVGAGGSELAKVEKGFEEESRHNAVKHMLLKVIETRDNNQSIKDLQIIAELFEEGELIAVYADSAD